MIQQKTYPRDCEAITLKKERLTGVFRLLELEGRRRDQWLMWVILAPQQPRETYLPNRQRNEGQR